ncbi:MAG: hypothetical protein NVS9B1_03280 [Candidatus Dormibacteraceae bacterium]
MISPTHDPIRVVPLHLPETTIRLTAGPSPTPLLTYRGGHLLTAVQVFTVFWGAAWEQGPQAGVMASVNQFFDLVLTSPLMDQLAEYSVPGHAIGHGKHIGTTVLKTPLVPHAVRDHQIQQLLETATGAGGGLPAPTPQTLYFVYLPPGVTVTQGGGRSCMTFCGYHSDIGGSLFYAVMPYPGCSGCTGGLQPLDALTSTSSHELCEAVTDAVPGQGWYDDLHGEIGDICAWKTKTIGAYTVQLEWSNKAGACV